MSEMFTAVDYLVNYVLKATADFDNDGTEETLEYSLELNRDIGRKGDIPFTGIATNRPENNQQFGFEGKTEQLSFRQVIHNNGEDKSNGTFSNLNLTDSNISGGTIETVQEQIYFLRQYVHSPIFGASWTLEGGEFTDYDGDGTDEGTPVATSTVNITENADDPTVAVADFKLKVGQVV